MVITQVGTTHGLTHSTILGITDMLAGMEVGILLGVELAIVAILVLALEVVDAVGHIAGLLDFSHETTGAE